MDAGVRCISLDTIEREDPESPVLMRDATTFQYSKGTLVVLARPCHGPWIGQVVNRAHECGAEVLYIGKSRNVRMDIGSFDRKMIFKCAGLDKENVYSMAPKRPDTTKFCLVKFAHHRSPWWMEDGGDRWINCVGGYCPKGKKDKVLETCEVEDYEDLDHTKTGLLIPEGKADAGWIDRKGKFYGCDSSSHDSLIHLIVKSCVSDVEDKGWTRVYSIERNEYVVGGDAKMNDDQRRTAKRIGLKPKEWDDD